jgi:aminoglycoside/choline kinase family phosphotransferase
MVLARPIDPPYEPFDRMAGFLAEGGFPVPRVLERHEREGVLVLEDLGDESMQAHLMGPAGRDPGRWRSLYEEAVDLIVRLQRDGTRALTPDVPAHHFALDGFRFRRELEYFREHYVRRLLGDPLGADPAAADLLRAGLDALAERAGRSEDRVLCHRDFHSRNLMLPPGGRDGARLVMIDFQDARLGPRAYDLASLLADAYLDVPEDLAAAMQERFLAGVGRAERADAFRRDLAEVTAQRTLKAVGTFAGQATRFNVVRYLEYIPRALDRAAAALGELPEHAGLGDLLRDRLAYRGERPEARPPSTGS